MKDISTIRRTVATMANQLHKLGYSLSQAFKTAWRRVKMSITCRVSARPFHKFLSTSKSLLSFNRQSNILVL